MTTSDPNQRIAFIKENGVDFESRTLYIFDEVGQKNQTQIPALRILDETDGSINILINSPGGDASIGVALYDCIKSLRNPTVSMNVGRAFSIAALILQAAGRRLMLPNAEIMIHNGFMVNDVVEIDNESLQSMMDDSKRSDAVYHKILAGRTGLPVSKIAKWCETDTFFSAKESLKFGFVDSVMDKGFIKPLRSRK